MHLSIHFHKNKNDLKSVNHQNLHHILKMEKQTINFCINCIWLMSTENKKNNINENDI